ncbi:HAMP domain-containing sensor histidine kinase [Balneolales bacterium ANBcel1]|nr:HAMP domain-containing sensor histidine kinase [Balneolales bacterium ANBcel1]
MNQFKYVRWVFLAMGLVAIFGLTGMNVYSLYALHDNAVKNSVEKQKRQMLEYSDQIRSRLRYPRSELWQLDMPRIKSTLTAPDQVAEELVHALQTAGNDSIFSTIYLSPAECSTCDRQGGPIWRYEPESGRFHDAPDYSHLVSDGLTMAKTRMSSLINEYQWNTHVFFDTHNSMTIALIHVPGQQIIAYLTFLIDREYLVQQYMSPKLLRSFGEGKESGIVLWLHDWTKNEVLATNDPGVDFSYQKVDFIQNFPDLLNDWNLKAAFTANPDIAASRASLTRNLFVLGGAVFLIIAAMAFIFYTAQRERSLAERQATFLANVTHELQTPLSVILAAGENLSDGRVNDSGRLRSYGKHIYNESLRLRAMIERLLDTARVSTGNIQPRQELLDLSPFTRSLLKRKQSWLESSGVQITFEAEDKPAHIYADPGDLTSSISNLIENAIKYSPEEKFLAIRILQRNGSVDLEVEDHGIGIPKKAQKHIFDKFFRVEDALTAKTKGHGLGLAIVKDLVSRNGGSVHVASTPGKGSTFTIRFPAGATGKSSEFKEDQKTNAQETTHVS